MAFVPSVPPSGQQDLSNASPRVRDLTLKLTQTIEEFRRYYPDTTDANVQKSLRITSAGRGGASGAVAVAAAACAAGAGVVVAITQQGHAGLNPAMLAGIVAALAAVVGVAIRISRRS